MTLTTYRLDRQGADRLLFLFHGYGAEQHHLAAYVPLVDPEERFTAICPRAPHDLPDGDGATWFAGGSGGADPDAFLETVAALDTLIAAEAEAAGVGPDRCVVGGFSQGGYLALALAGRRGAPPYAGVWAMCCRMPTVDGFALDLAGASGRRALIQLGEHDPIIEPDTTRAAGAQLEAAGWQVRLEGYAMAHSQTIEMMLDAREWLASLP